MINRAVTTLESSHEVPLTRSSSWEFNQDYDEQDRNITRLVANLQYRPSVGHLNAVTDEMILETDPPTDTVREIAWTKDWPLHLAIFSGLSPVRSWGVLTDDPIREASALTQEAAKRVERAFQTHQKYTRRIEQLRGYAEEDGIFVNNASVRDFWSFVRLGDPDRRAGVMLLDNGNLRAVWKDDDASHVGIQFFGDGRAEYVIFNRRPATTEVSRVAGIDTLKGIKRQIQAFDLTSLIDA